jgi:hypothetical protein
VKASGGARLAGFGSQSRGQRDFWRSRVLAGGCVDDQEMDPVAEALRFFSFQKRGGGCGYSVGKIGRR